MYTSILTKEERKAARAAKAKDEADAREKAALGARRSSRTQGQLVHGYLAHKKQPHPPRATIGPWAKSYGRVLGGRCFFMSEVKEAEGGGEGGVWREGEEGGGCARGSRAGGAPICSHPGPAGGTHQSSRLDQFAVFSRRI